MRQEPIYIPLGHLFRLMGIMLLVGVGLPWFLTLFMDYPALLISVGFFGFTFGFVFGAYRMIGVMVNAMASQRGGKDG